MRICFWQRDLLLFGQGFRLLATCRFAWGSLTSLRWRIRELARAAIFQAPTSPAPHQPLAARWRPGVGGYSGPPPCPLTQGDGAPRMEIAGRRRRLLRMDQRSREGQKKIWKKEGWIPQRPTHSRKVMLVEVWIEELLPLKCPLGCTRAGSEQGSGEAFIRLWIVQKKSGCYPPKRQCSVAQQCTPVPPSQSECLLTLHLQLFGDLSSSQPCPKIFIQRTN